MIDRLKNIKENIDMSQQMRNFGFVNTLTEVHNGYLRSEKYSTRDTHSPQLSELDKQQSGQIGDKINKSEDKAIEIVQPEAYKRIQ